MLAALNGLLYAAVVDATLANNGAGQLQVQALSVGALGNASVGTTLQFVSPVLGVASAAIVGADGLAGGADIEGIDAYRARVVERFALQPHGGNQDDYVTWAKAQPSVTRAWVLRNWVGLGTVGVFVVNDNAADITLTAPELERVKVGIEDLRPVTAEVYVQSPTLVPVHYTLSVTPDTVRVRAAVEAALQALHARESDLGARMYLTHISEAISGAAGEDDHHIASPAADLVPAAHELLVYGGVTWL